MKLFLLIYILTTTVFETCDSFNFNTGEATEQTSMVDEEISIKYKIFKSSETASKFVNDDFIISTSMIRYTEIKKDLIEIIETDDKTINIILKQRGFK